MGEYVVSFSVLPSVRIAPSWAPSVATALSWVLGWAVQRYSAQLTFLGSGSLCTEGVGPDGPDCMILSWMAIALIY